MIVERTSIFNASPERIWQEMLTTRLLHYVASPVIKFIPVHSELPSMWKEGEYLVDMRLFSFIPFGRQSIVITSPSQAEKEGHLYVMLDDGRGQIIRQWWHFITVDSAEHGKARYTDRIDLRAGILTPFIWLFTSLFFWHRQSRWKRLIANDFNYHK